MKLNVSVSAKFLTYQMISLLVLVAVIGWFQYKTVRDGLYKKTEQSGQNLLQTLEDVIAEEPHIFNTDKLQRIVLRFTSKIPDVHRVSVIDHSFNIIADSDPKLVGQYTDQNALIALLREEKEISFYYTHDGQKYYRLSRPIKGRYDPIRQSHIIGAYAIEMNISQIDNKVGRDFSSIMLIISGLVLLSGLAQYLLMRRSFVRPLLNLSSVAERLGRGYFSARATVSTNDELADLAHSFNNMVENLQKTTVSKAYLDNIIQSMSEALVVVRPEGTIQTINQFALNLLGYPEEQLIGQPIEMILEAAASSVADIESLASHIVKKETMNSVEMRYLAKGGHQIPILFSSSVMYNQDGQMEGIVCVAQDITERKRFDTAIQKANTQLQESAAELALANRHLEQLLYSITHDLKEPLRSIQFFSDRVHARYASQLDGKGQDYLERVMRAASRQRQLLKDISLLAQVQQETPMATEAISATTIVQAALARLETQINETEAQVDVAPDLPVIQANQKWASQAVYELVSNALKYTADDHPPEVQIAPYDGPKGIGLIIKDRGPSVKPAHAERIWGLFQRAVGRDIEGTGAGLAIVRQIAERHGGHAWLRARDGGGAEFIITFGAR